MIVARQALTARLWQGDGQVEGGMLVDHLRIQAGEIQTMAAHVVVERDTRFESRGDLILSAAICSLTR